MTRMLGLITVFLLTALAACGGGGGNNNTSAGGLTPLDFDVVTDPTSTVGADDVIGYAVSITNPAYAAAEAEVPSGYKLASLLYFQPETAPDSGFSGNLTVRTPDRSTSAIGEGSWGVVYRGVWDSRSQVWNAFRAGVYGQGSSGFNFHLDFLGYVMLLRPTGSQFEAAAFADLAVAQFDTPINFWATSRNADGGNPRVDYRWDFGDGASAVGQEVTHTYPTLGEYNVTVTAVDGAGNVAPVASTAITILGNPVELSQVVVVVTENPDGSFDYNPTLDGGTPPFEYEWDLDGDGDTDSTDRNPTFVPPAAGVYVFELTVTDQTGATATAIGIADSRRLELSGDVLTGYAPHAMTFALSTQGVGSEDSVEVDYADGTSGVVDAHTFLNPGVYPVVARATRIVNGVEVTKESNEVLVTVDPRPNPVINSATPGRAPVGATVRLAGEFFFLPEVDDEVLLNGLQMPVVLWTPDFIDVTVPVGAHDGDIVVHKALGNLDSNGFAFDVAPTTPGQPGVGQL
jgi:PKD repeat protein